MKEKIRTYTDGEPLSADLNNLIDAIEKTPVRKFDIASSDINLNEMTNAQKIEYFDKNPQSLFTYNREYGQTSAIFTNFSYKKRTGILSYDIIRIDADYATDLTKLKEVDKHSGLEIHEIGAEYWNHIDFLTTPFRLLNWRSIPWEDLK